MQTGVRECQQERWQCSTGVFSVLCQGEAVVLEIKGEQEELQVLEIKGKHATNWLSSADMPRRQILSLNNMENVSVFFCTS